MHNRPFELIRHHTVRIDNALLAAANDPDFDAAPYIAEIARSLGVLDIALNYVHARRAPGLPFNGNDVFEMRWFECSRPPRVEKALERFRNPELANQPDDARRLGELLDMVLGDE